MCARVAASRPITPQMTCNTLAIFLLATLSLSTIAHAQSLVDAAAKAKQERRDEVAQPGTKVYTNEDLPAAVAARKEAVQAAIESAAAAKAAAIVAARVAETAAAEKAAAAERLLKLTPAERAAEAQAAAEKIQATIAVSKARRDLIATQFSPWDHSHRGLTAFIKASMNDPSSYDHVSTRFVDMGTHLVVTTTFRGKNGFGALVKNSVTAIVALNGNVVSVTND